MSYKTLLVPKDSGYTQDALVSVVKDLRTRGTIPIRDLDGDTYDAYLEQVDLTERGVEVTFGFDPDKKMLNRDRDTPKDPP